MINPAEVNIVADRYTPFVLPILVIGIDLTGATFAVQVRDRKNGGAVRATLGTVGSISSQGITFVSAQTFDSVIYSNLWMRIDEATMEAMPDSSEVAENLNIFWDMHVTPTGDVKQVYFAGAFTVRGGVTQ